jgi:glycosyltransferase involved in cell wall biosynthesis
MPTGNRPQFVARAVENFLAQTFVDSELVIVDDTCGLALDLQPNDRIRYYHYPKNPRLKLGAKRNFSNALARGEIIAHWDDDDWSASTRLAEQVSFLRNSGAQVAGYKDLLYYSEFNRRFYQYFYWGTVPYVVGTSLCYFKDYWDTHRFADKHCGEDTEFTFRAAREHVLLGESGLGKIVARAHRQSTSKAELGGAQFPEISAKLMPEEFLRTIGWKRN